MSDTRIRMTETKGVDLGAGPVRLRGGEFYLLPEEIASDLVDQRLAYEEGDPPECDVCGGRFEGVGAYVGRDRHRGEDHGSVAVDWSPFSDQEPPPLDDDHRDVERLRDEHTVAELKQKAHDLGVSSAEIVATGASGPVQDDYVRHILRARGRKGFYARRDADEEE